MSFSTNDINVMTKIKNNIFNHINSLFTFCNESDKPLHYATADLLMGMMFAICYFVSYSSIRGTALLDIDKYLSPR